MLIFLESLSQEEKDLVEDLYNKLNKQMHRMSIAVLKNEKDAEEAVSNTFLKVMEKKDKIFQLSCQEREAYCVSILKNESINILRINKKSIKTEDIDLFFNVKNHKEKRLEDLVGLNFQIEKLNKYLDKLKEEERIILYLRYIDNMKFKEIGKLLGISENTANKKCERTLKKLKEYFEKEEKYE